MGSNETGIKMSSKPSTAKVDQKISQREVMVTRHKSAQMKRQLRVKDRSMKHLTDLLKSPTKDHTASRTVPMKKKQPSPKAKQSLLKSVEKIQNLPQKTFKLSKVLRKEIHLVQNEEYYPNKRKRKRNVNKVTLRAKPNMKVVGEITGSVKRKYATPCKASDEHAHQTLQPVPNPAKLSMAEAIRIMDEQLTDEDLMEILTCPSPVWWEDPPDDDYVEDAIFTRHPSKKVASSEKPEPMPAEPNIESTDKVIVIPNLSAKTDKFLKKRSKLEDLLGNIREKSKPSSVSKTSKEVAECSNKTMDTNEIKVDVKNSGVLEKKLSESDDEIVFHNTSMNEDELLKDLENMDIPIADQKSDDVIVIDDDEDFLDKPTNEANEIKEIKTENEEIGVTSDNVEFSEDTNTHVSNEEMPKNLTANQKCSLVEEIASMKSLDSLSSKSSVTSPSSGKDMDTISDTNIKFILEEEADDAKMTVEIKEETDKCVKSELKDFKNESSNDSITVYKIIEEIKDTAKSEYVRIVSNEREITNVVDAKLNDYFKKCKKVYHRIKKEEKTDINKNEVSGKETDYSTIFCDQCKPNFKKVSDIENVKYCLNCSSIFDSKECTYCIKKSNRSCDLCKVKFCCEVFYKIHTNNCSGTKSGCMEGFSGIPDKLDSMDSSIRVLSCPVSL